MAKSLNEYYQWMYGGDSSPSQEWVTGGGKQEYDKWLADQAAAEDKRIADLAAQGLNPDGSPKFDTLIDPATGKLKDIYQLDPSKLEGYNMIRNLAKADLGTSDYAKTAQAKNIFERQNQIDAASAQAGAGTRQAIGTLAARGGVGSGARERIASQGALGLMGAKQGAYREAAGRGLDILGQEEQMRRGAIDKFATAEGQAAQYNLGNLLAENQAKRDFTLEKWGAEKQAEATRKSGGGGGGGCFITTAACEHMGFADDSAFLNTFRKFRDEHMGGKNSEELKEYYEIAPKIVEKIGGDRTVYSFITSEWLLPSFKAIQAGENEKAHAMYKEMVNWLKEKYLEV